MTRGKPWSLSDEKRLRELLKAGRNAMEIAVAMDKTFESVRAKIWNLGLSLKETTPAKSTVVSFSSLDLSQGLPSIEEKLKVMNAALVALEQPNLSRNEVLRLRGIILSVKEYRVEFEKFVGYRELELECLELERKVEAAKREILESRKKVEESNLESSEFRKQLDELKLENLELRKKLEASTTESDRKSGSDISSA